MNEETLLRAVVALETIAANIESLDEAVRQFVDQVEALTGRTVRTEKAFIRILAVE